MSKSSYEMLIEQVREIRTLESIESLLGWDQHTYMPERGAAHRANQIALVAASVHERFTSAALGTLLEQAEGAADRSDPVVATNLRELRRDYDRAVKLPTKLVRAIAQAGAEAFEAWKAARAHSDFPQFAPHLARLLELKREVADRIGWQQERYDALLDEFEPGECAAGIHELFAALRSQLVALTMVLQAAPRQPDLELPRRPAPVAQQAAFNRAVADAMGFDFTAGRLDVSAHPFTTALCPQDVRITTRYDERNIADSLFSVIHEVGHALYEQGYEPRHAGTPMGTYVSFGLHESQSRLWENLVGRSRPFWQHFLPKLQDMLPDWGDTDLNDWLLAINAVRPSLVRVAADEVTYGLHIILRFELERKLVGGELAVADVPEAWNERMRELLGIVPPDDAQGCLQDVHWSMGAFGYFPSYQLGNIYAAQLFAAARRALPELDAQIARGQLRPLLEWLRENVHRHGKRYRARELLRVVTGQELSIQPFVDYLNGKYRRLYGLES
jgi:carboxypeptidase Taq